MLYVIKMKTLIIILCLNFYGCANIADYTKERDLYLHDKATPSKEVTFKEHSDIEFKINY